VIHLTTIAGHRAIPESDANSEDKAPSAAVGILVGAGMGFVVLLLATFVDKAFFDAAHMNALVGAMIGACVGGALGWYRGYLRRRRGG
jgi:hypothetical protein